MMEMNSYHIVTVDINEIFNNLQKRTMQVTQFGMRIKVYILCDMYVSVVSVCTCLCMEVREILDMNF
jgi:hypothetical protein